MMLYSCYNLSYIVLVFTVYKQTLMVIPNTRPATLEALVLTEDHYPTNKSERERIQASHGVHYSHKKRYNTCTKAQG